MLENKFEYLVGFFCCVTDSTGKEYTRHYIDKPADSAQRDARSAYNNYFDFFGFVDFFGFFDFFGFAFFAVSLCLVEQLWQQQLW